MHEVVIIFGGFVPVRFGSLEGVDVVDKKGYLRSKSVKKENKRTLLVLLHNHWRGIYNEHKV